MNSNGVLQEIIHMAFDKLILALTGTIAILVLLLFLAGACAVCGAINYIPSHYPDTSHESKEYYASHAMARNITIDATTFNGDVTLLNSCNDTIDVMVRVTAPAGHIDDLTPGINFSGNSDDLWLNMEAARTDRTPSMGNYGAEITLYLPEDSKYRVSITTSNGKVYANSFTGERMAISTSNGNIMVGGGEYNSIDLNTSNGNIIATYLATDAVLESSNGNIDINTTQTSGSLRVKASNGDITVKVPENAGFSIDATASNGRIRPGMRMNLTTAMDNHISGETAEHPAGNFSMSLRTSNGGINIIA